MKPFKTLTATVCPLDAANVDTDQIIPKQFLKRVERTGFGQYLFYDWRFLDNGNKNLEFNMNKVEYAGSEILIARDNFGCGSSREHAPWALLDYGFRVIIAPSFADIFYNNCIQNGILPIVLSSDEVDSLFQAVAEDTASKFEINLHDQKITGSNLSFPFAIDDDLKEKLLKGQDDIDWTLQFVDAIDAYEASN